MKLTEKEVILVKAMLLNNDCGARNFKDLSYDNYTYQTIDELMEMTELSEKQITGLISSLQTKGVLYIEERDGYRCTSKNKFVKYNFEPNLYWISDTFINENIKKEFNEI